MVPDAREVLDALQVSDARRYPAGEVSDARRYQTRAGIPRRRQRDTRSYPTGERGVAEGLGGGQDR